MKFGLCCLFHEEPITFKTYTFKGLETLAQKSGVGAVTEKIAQVWMHNMSSLQEALDYCKRHDIAGFRITSDLFPQLNRVLAEGYVSDTMLADSLAQLGKIDASGVILSMHPGQHVNLGSPTPAVVENSVIDLKDHLLIAKAVGCREINIHIGGVYGNKEAAMVRFAHEVTRLPDSLQAVLTIENDELNYAISDVVSVAKDLGLRAVYDIHHQRCHELKYEKSGSDAEYLELARSTWPSGQLQRLHLSSPKNGFTSITKARAHSDYIDVAHVPDWLWKADVLVDIEAKAKECAIQALRDAQEKRV